MAKRYLQLLFMLAALSSTNALPTLADATNPIADIEGAADSRLLKRYEGAFIVSYESRAYAELRIPLSPLQPGAPGEYDAMNNRIYRPERAETLEGKVTRLVYLVPDNRSPLEVLRNYQDEITAAGGQVEFECKRDECGGDANRAAYGGGNKMSLMQYFFYESDIKDAPHSNGACALTSHINDQHFITARIPQGNATAWVAVQTFQLDAGTYCKALNGRTIIVVHVLEPKAREQKMVLVKAEVMADAIDHDGSIALYGIYFDTAKADLTPDSAPTLKEIALLEGRPELVLLIVGHTDSQGSYDYNLDLSARRANAAKAALVSSYGVDARRLTAAGAGMMAPVASNATDEGRAKNRRVTIVQVN